MSTGFDAVYEELKRLQLEGMERVFIEDSTLARLELAAKPPIPKAPPITIDLQSAVNSDKQMAMTDTAPPPSAPVKTPKKSSTPLPQAPTLELPSGDASAQMQWLNERIRNCPTCSEQLRDNEQIVFGSGALDADIFYCGQAPGEEEAATGSPFQGNAGELLTKILSAMGLKRDAVYMTNIMKWRPKHHKPYGNRPPTQEEMEYCLPFLKAQIQIVQPKVIIGLGNSTVPGLLGPNPDRTMASMRGTWQSFEGIPLIFTYHPSYLLFNDTMKTKRAAWEDMLKAMEKVGLPISAKQKGYFLPK
jgi:DNA polymerase